MLISSDRFETNTKWKTLDFSYLVLLSFLCYLLTYIQMTNTMTKTTVLSTVISQKLTQHLTSLLCFSSQYPWITGRWTSRPPAYETGQHVTCGGCGWSWEGRRVCGGSSSSCRGTWEPSWAYRVQSQVKPDQADISHRIGKIWTGTCVAYLCVCDYTFCVVFFSSFILKPNMMFFLAIQCRYFWKH